MRKLTRCRQNGEPYRRPDDVETHIGEVEQLARDDVRRRAQIRRKDHPDYIRSEALVYLLREVGRDNRGDYFAFLYRELIRRLEKATLNPIRNIGSDKTSVDERLDRIRSDVRDRINKILAEGLNGVSDAVDILECSFDSAVARARLSASGRAGKRRRRERSLSDEEIYGDDDETAGEFTALNVTIFREQQSRMRLAAMIDALDDDDRRIFQMLKDGYPIESGDPDVTTISGMLKRDPTTIQKRKRAIVAMLRGLVEAERAL